MLLVSGIHLYHFGSYFFLMFLFVFIFLLLCSVSSCFLLACLFFIFDSLELFYIMHTSPLSYVLNIFLKLIFPFLNLLIVFSYPCKILCNRFHPFLTLWFLIFISCFKGPYIIIKYKEHLSSYWMLTMNWVYHGMREKGQWWIRSLLLLQKVSY